jgi:hypothetical protein
MWEMTAQNATKKPGGVSATGLSGEVQSAPRPNPAPMVRHL